MNTSEAIQRAQANPNPPTPEERRRHAAAVRTLGPGSIRLQTPALDTVEIVRTAPAAQKAEKPRQDLTRLAAL